MVQEAKVSLNPVGIWCAEIPVQRAPEVIDDRGDGNEPSSVFAIAHALRLRNAAGKAGRRVRKASFDACVSCAGSGAALIGLRGERNGHR